MKAKHTGVLLLAFGGPDSPEAIEPFMINLMSGRVPPPPLVEKIKARYALIGGKSPLPEITRRQAAELQAYLNRKADNFTAAVGMRYWHPFITEGLKMLEAQGAERIVAVSLAPFYSQVSTGAYEDELNRAVSVLGIKAQVKVAPAFYDNPLFIDGVAQNVAAALENIPADKRTEVPVIFSAHSLPATYVEEGDPYAEQFKFTAGKLAERLKLNNWFLAYQSKGGGQGKWLGPMVEDIMDEIRGRGFDEVLVVPVGFVSDHIETLYDIDIAQKAHARDNGLTFYRSASLNTSQTFIQALADTVLRELK